MSTHWACFREAEVGRDGEERIHLAYTLSASSSEDPGSDQWE